MNHNDRKDLNVNADSLAVCEHRDPYVVIVNSSGNDIAGTIDSHYYLGCGSRGGIEREYVVYEITSEHKE